MLYADLLILQNVAQHQCTVTGYPRLAFTGAAGPLPIVQRDVTGQGPVPIRLIVLEPGGSASAAIATGGRQCAEASPPPARASVTTLFVTLNSGTKKSVSTRDMDTVPCGDRPDVVYPLIAGDRLPPPGEDPYGPNQ